MTSSFLKQATEGNKNAILKQQIICQYIFSGDLSITDLSRAVNLSVPTVTKLIGELIDEGFVHNFGEQGSAGGRRPEHLRTEPLCGLLHRRGDPHRFAGSGSRQFQGSAAVRHDRGFRDEQ